jgi:hypothetical protein
MTSRIRDRIDNYLVAPMCPDCGRDREGIFVRGELGDLICRGHESHPLHPLHHEWLLARLRK